VNLVTLVQLREGTIRPLRIPAYDWAQCQPCPDGRHIAGLVSRPVEDFTDRLQIWDTKDSTLVGEIFNPKQRILNFRWTADGRFLIVLLPGKDGKAQWEFYTRKGDSAGVVRGPPYPAVFSPSGDLVATQVKEPRADARHDIYQTRVLKSRTGEEVATLPGTRFHPVTTFLDEDRLLLASRLAGDPIRLVRVSDQKVLWEANAASEVRNVLWEPNSTAVVIDYGTYAGADVLSIKEGQRLPGDGLAPGWQKPTLLHGGRLALDPLCDSSVLRLRETATGRTVATFAAFADLEWIIYTPEGLWTGSEKALDWVTFYRGADPLTPEEVAALRQPEAVRVRLETAFR
jgi:hypothetical protein